MTTPLGPPPFTGMLGTPLSLKSRVIPAYHKAFPPTPTPPIVPIVLPTLRIGGGGAAIGFEPPLVCPPCGSGLWRDPRCPPCPPDLPEPPPDLPPEPEGPVPRRLRIEPEPEEEEEEPSGEGPSGERRFRVSAEARSPGDPEVVLILPEVEPEIRMPPPDAAPDVAPSNVAPDAETTPPATPPKRKRRRRSRANPQILEDVVARWYTEPAPELAPAPIVKPDLTWLTLILAPAAILGVVIGIGVLLDREKRKMRPTWD